MHRRFSGHGQPATDFERRLLLDSEHPLAALAAVIGVDAVLLCCDHFAGDRVCFPRRGVLMRMLYMPMRDGSIVERWLRGSATIQELADEYEMSRPGVYRVLRKHGAIRARLPADRAA